MPPKKNNSHVIKKELELQTAQVHVSPQTPIQVSARIPKQLIPPQRIAQKKTPVNKNAQAVNKNAQAQRGRRVPVQCQLREGDPLRDDAEGYDGFWDAVQGLLDISKPNQSNGNAQK
ncbi:hypothetical protein GCK72_024013 [Caenorhabditis remanei]|uniref:Uncharacterized protein n=1 Tax=Caenorhabditis remanei TaxID=31234 RepID=A0A6A5FY03_CAERE|nr:hypothetical protein GCK72_024013 [Caenorhabditis remanei]KAF1747548.1 hypothetical protein GCK72_024013 [Caenorhabditis remanei]